MNTTDAKLSTEPEKYLLCPETFRYITNPAFAALWEPYLDEGYSYTAVGQIFGVSRNTVKRFFPDRGWTMKQSLELGTFMKHHNAKMRKATFARSM